MQSSLSNGTGFTNCPNTDLGAKKAKARLTFLACANADCSKKICIMVVETAFKHRVFKEKTRAELGIDYYANKKA